MQKFIGMKTLKTAIGASVAMLITEALGIKFAASAGIITILSIQSTRRESVLVAFKRLVATVIALAIGSVTFFIGGFNAISFGVYLLFFIPIVVKLRVTEGIAPASVLVTHLLGVGSITSEIILNEMWIMLIGIGVALIVNLYMPSLEENLLVERRKIESQMYEIFIKMEKALMTEQYEWQIEDELNALGNCLNTAMNKAIQFRNNSFVGKRCVYEKYFEMRYSQYQVMLYMQKHFQHLYMVAKEAYEIAQLTHQVAESVRGKVIVEVLLEEVGRLRLHFKESQLPTSRDEFENRAMLYQFLTDIEQYLTIKKQFKDALTEKERKEYSHYYETKEK